MTDFILIVLSLSLSGTLLILILLVFCSFFSKYMSKTWQYYIWLLVLIRLLIPLAMPFNPVGNLFTTAMSKNPAMQAPVLIKESALLTNGDSSVLAAKTSPDSKDFSAGYQTGIIAILPILTLIWCIGALTLLFRKAAAYHSFVLFARAGRKVCGSKEVEDAYEHACLTAGIHKKLAIYVNPLITSPMLVGIFTPFLVIPDENLTNRDLYYIFLHELTHCKRGDILYKWAVQFVICLHWFNPFVYCMRKKLNQYCELSCDEAVIRTMDTEEKRYYGDTLLHAVGNNVGYTNSIVSLTLNEDAALIKERLGFLMKYKKKTKLHTAASVAAAVVIAFGAVLCGCVLPVSAKPKSETLATPLPESEDQAYNDIKANDGQPYYQQYYFVNSYFISIAWNIDPDKFHSKLPIDSDPSYFVGFPEGLTYYADNEEVRKAVIMAMAELTKVKNKNYSLLTPMVADVQGPFTASVNELSEQFYKEDHLVYFSTVIKKADQKTVKSLLKKAYEEERIAYYTILAEALEEEERNNSSLIEQAYAEDKLPYFVSLVNSGSLSSEALADFADRAYREDRLPYFVSLMSSGSLSSEALADFADHAYREDRLPYFTSLVNSGSLSSEALADFADHAYREDRLPYFTSLVNSGSLSSEALADFADHAYREDRLPYFTSLVNSGSLSSEALADFADRAYREERIAYFTVLNHS